MKRDLVIRPIEERDKGNYLRLFNEEDYGCIGINSDLKPSIYEEEGIVTGVINQSIVSTAILVVEENGEFIGYASISRPSEHRYHIGQFVIRKDKQKKGYGKRLMEEVKSYASSDDCDITLECISKAIGFFKKQGFINKFSSTFFYPRKRTIFPKKKSLFVDYKLIEQEREEKIKQEQESFQKFLQSQLFKEIMKLWYNKYEKEKRYKIWV